MPAAFPPADESKPIAAQYLADPLVQNALAYVKSVVPAEYLNIPPSTYKSSCVANYNADPNQYCYWPNALCVRETDTAAYPADVWECPGDNQWGLTYDDGPITNVVNGKNVNDTVALRQALTSANVKATFFIVGAMGVTAQSEITSCYQDGHEIATHSWTHWTSTALTNEQFVAEMKYTEALVYKATGQVPRFWRPPCGDVDDRIRAIAGALGYKTVLWGTNPSRDSTDADVSTTAANSRAVLKIIKSWWTPQPGFISLEHDISTFTIGIAIEALKEMQAMGASFPLKPMAVGTCLGQPSYWNGQVSGTTSSTTVPPVPTTTTTTTVPPAPTTTTSSVPSTTSTTSFVPPVPSPSTSSAGASPSTSKSGSSAAPSTSTTAPTPTPPQPTQPVVYESGVSLTKVGISVFVIMAVGMLAGML